MFIYNNKHNNTEWVVNYFSNMNEIIDKYKETRAPSSVPKFSDLYLIKLHQVRYFDFSLARL